MGYGKGKTEGGHKRGHSAMALWVTHQEAKTEAHRALERVRAGIENELRAGERELEQLSRVLAVELAGRVLGRPVDGAAPGTQGTSNN